MSLPAMLHPFTPPARETGFVEIVAGEGAVVTDAAGQQYIDAMAALWFVNVGYGRREVVDAIASQAATQASKDSRIWLVEKFVWQPAPFQSPLAGLASKVASQS